MSETENRFVVVRNTISGTIADVDFGPQDTIQDLHNSLLSSEFLSEKRIERNVDGDYEFTLMPDNTLLRPNQLIASLPLTTASVIEVSWAFRAGGGRSQA